MTITINRFTLEITWSYAYIRLPGIGEGYIWQLGYCWVSWVE